mmetsp:Transcript_3067/g.5274  ORF Transcript_3067/g.5274 Transcript_3067/m.5274 type:complete len:591 (+) Transcript_3067:48-1820(+)
MTSAFCFSSTVRPSNSLLAPALNRLSISTQSFRATSTRRSHTSRLVCQAGSSDSDSNKRQAWPIDRFLKQWVFFTPLGRFLNMSDQMTTDKVVPSSSRLNKYVLVTGATGGTGKRVVKELQARNRKVRAVVRDKARAEKIFRDFKIDPSKVDIVVADLYNLHPDFIKDVDAIVSCTGTKVGPVDDTPDRSKYYQGVVFYPPEVLEDTPQNIEYVGIQRLVDLGQKIKDNQTEQASSDQDATLITFESADTLAKTWGPVDDVVMGGVSQSKIEFAVEPGTNKNIAKFCGNVSTRNSGGFASVKTVPFTSPLDLSNYTAFKVRVKGDGQRFKFIVRCDPRWDSISFCYSFDTRAGEWQDIVVPFDKLLPVFRAKTLQDGTRFNSSTVYAFQLMLSKFEYDGELNPKFTAGPFEIQVESIKATGKLGGQPTTNVVQRKSRPKIIHVGSAGCTRVLRKAEFPDLSTQPPAVRMNDMLGRILEWKLAGEDAIRASGIPYLIIRPCALTEEPRRGYSGLRVSQGDTMTGKMSRDDLATLIVDALDSNSLTNKTFELAELKEAESNDDIVGLSDLAQKLVEDREESRTYSKFPYVPL